MEMKWACQEITLTHHPLQSTIVQLMTWDTLVDPFYGNQIFLRPQVCVQASVHSILKDDNLD